MFGSLAMDPSTAIERHNNFRHIFQSLLVLFRSSFTLMLAMIVRVTVIAMIDDGNDEDGV